MATYKINLLSASDLDKFERYLVKMERILEKDEFKEFILEKCQKTLKNICNMSFPIPNESSSITQEYMSHMGYIIEDDRIILYNDSVINIQDKNMKETTKAKYPAQLSLAKIIEYGIGFTGAQSVLSENAKNWKYDVNNHGGNGWYYKDEHNNIIWTNGFEGRFIFFKLAQNVEQYIGDWINEYIEANFKD